MKFLPYLLICLGAVIGGYASNQYVLILGILLLMFGVFKISSRLSSNKAKKVLEVKEDTNNKL